MNAKSMPSLKTANAFPVRLSHFIMKNFLFEGYLRYPEWNKAKSAGDSVKGCSLYQHGKCVVDYVKNFDSSHCDCIQACSERIPEGQLTQYGYDSYTMMTF